MTTIDSNPDNSATAVSRRDFVKFAGAAGASMALVRPTWAQAQGGGDPINTAIIGVGRQGKIILNHSLKIPGVHFKAVCDIWPYSQRIGSGLCKRSKQQVNLYENHKQMLAQERDLDAVLIATPDFWHAPIAIDCLEAGLHVYCEKEMSNEIEKARAMVLASRQAGKLLQIGHQRRSNPFYRHAYRLMHKDRVFGDITTVNGQWNQLKPLAPMPKRLVEKWALPEQKLAEYGYETMDQFYNWRWFRKYAGGPMADLGSHQVDVFIWYLRARPSSVFALGGVERAVAKAKKNKVGYVPECFDHTLSLYEFQTDHGSVRGFYQVNLTTSHGGFFEEFMGDQGSMTISEINAKNAMFRERVAEAKEWEDDAEKFEKDGKEAMNFDPLKSRKAKGKMDKEGMKIEKDLAKPAHMPHLENFFAAIRGQAELTCPGDVGFETCVAVLKASESARTGRRIEFSPTDFEA